MSGKCKVGKYLFGHRLFMYVLQQIRKFIKAEGNMRREGRRRHKQQENVLEILCFVAVGNVKERHVLHFSLVN